MAEANKVPLTETPEFQKAVADAAAKAAAAAVESMRAELLAGAASGQGSGSDRGLMQELAMHIAQLTDQGTQRKRVAPEILAARAEANDKMIDRIMLARKRGEKPEYALVAKVYLNERFIEPFTRGTDKLSRRTEISWGGVPNEAMRPINDTAKEIYALFKASIGSAEKIQALDHRPFWMTPAGLVVKGDPPARREVLAPAAFADDLDVKTPFDPNVPEVHVLGTVAPPARQNFQTATPGHGH